MLQNVYMMNKKHKIISDSSTHRSDDQERQKEIKQMVGSSNDGDARNVKCIASIKHNLAIYMCWIFIGNSFVFIQMCSVAAVCTRIYATPPSILH